LFVRRWCRQSDFLRDLRGFDRSLR
jgi:hypothetical protein